MTTMTMMEKVPAPLWPDPQMRLLRVYMAHSGAAKDRTVAFAERLVLLEGMMRELCMLWVAHHAATSERVKVMLHCAAKGRRSAIRRACGNMGQSQLKRVGELGRVVMQETGQRMFLGVSPTHPEV